MFLRNVVGALRGGIGMWRYPAVWVALFLLVIGMIARVRTSLAFMPGLGGSQFEAVFPFLAGTAVHLVFLAGAIVLISSLTGSDGLRQEPQWGAAGGTLLLGIFAEIAFVLVLGTTLRRAAVGSPWPEMVGFAGDAMIMPAFVLMFARLDGDGTTGISDALRATYVVVAALIVIALGALLQTVTPKADVSMGLVPLLPSFTVTAAVTTMQLLIACSVSRAMTGASPPGHAFR